MSDTFAMHTEEGWDGEGDKGRMARSDGGGGGREETRGYTAELGEPEEGKDQAGPRQGGGEMWQLL